MDSCLRSPALPKVYLSLTLRHQQTVVVKVEMSSTFLNVPIKSNNLQPQVLNDKIRTCNESQRELAIVLKSPFNSDLLYRLRQGWKMSRMVTVIITVGRNN